MITVQTERILPDKKLRKKNIYLSDLKRNYFIYLMAVPVVLYYVVFHYAPMYGLIISFKDFSPRLGIMGSPWVGFKHFVDFFKSIYAWRIIRNTALINVYDLLFGFPAPIILALLLNEINSKYFKRTIQTVTYIPHFISIVIIAGVIIDFVASDGVVNDVIEWFGFNRSALLARPELFRTIFVGSGIWQSIGWGSIIYLAALSNINTELYQAAVIDGAGKWKQTIHVTLPGIASTIVILLILRMGAMMSVGFEKIVLLYNPLIYETSDVIQSYVYRKGLLEFSYGFSAAVGLINSLINCTLIIIANQISRKYSETSLW